jgi:hypothetical protein
MGPPLQREEGSDFCWSLYSTESDSSEHSLINWPFPPHFTSCVSFWLADWLTTKLLLASPAQWFLVPSPTGLMAMFLLSDVSGNLQTTTRSAGWRCQSHITTDGQSASQSWCQAPSGAQVQIFVTVRHLRVCRRGAPSLTRGRVCHLSRW